LAPVVCALVLATAHAATPQFEGDVLPILTAHCLKCHGREARKASLDLRTVALATRGGESGPVIVPGNAEESLLYERMADHSMPPAGELPLTAAQIEVIRDWLDAGDMKVEEAPALDEPSTEITAADREFWAFRRPLRRDPPEIRPADRARTPVDLFLLAKLSEHGLSFAPEADAQTLVRRAFFDLIGLPPTPEEIDQFVNDASPAAYDHLLDRLLASPHFGERWGRHWLDASGYVDVAGGDNDAGIIKLAEGKWRYRDYVIRSFNDDKPFDQFLTEQLAGDELSDWRTAEHFTPAMLENLIATTFLRSSADDTDENELNTADIRHGVLARTVETVASNLLGLTVNCARCHSHKYDPISHVDYYRLTAIFTPALNPQSWLQPRDRALADVAPRERAAAESHNASIQKQIDESKARLAELRRPYEAKIFETKLATIPDAIRADTKSAIETPKDKRNDVQKYLADKFADALRATPAEVDAALVDEHRRQVQELEIQLAELPKSLQKWGKIQAVYDSGPPPATYLLRRGNHETPGTEVAPGFLGILCQDDPRGLFADAQPRGESSGRRLALARWLTRRDTPAAGQVARTIVNRMWQQLFGVGLVETPDNFGHSGARPTHPELLDWLAIRWIDEGYRWKPLLKLLMHSAAYRQASSVAPSLSVDAQTLDPGNQLLWHQRLRRLESEAVRDAIVAASGTLDPQLFGPPIPIEARPDGSVVVKESSAAISNDGAKPDAPSRPRRSIYVLARRNYHPSMLGTFDQPVMATNCPRRNPSAVVLQSLAMLNDDFVVEQAGRFAATVAQLPVEQQVTAIFRRAVARVPSAQESAWSDELLARQFSRYRPQCETDSAARQQALAHLCQMVLNTSEFLYVP
jgi:hypothetical protein